MVDIISFCSIGSCRKGEMMSEKVNDTIALFISKLSEATGYKYLKSRRYGTIKRIRQATNS